VSKKQTKGGCCRKLVIFFVTMLCCAVAVVGAVGGVGGYFYLGNCKDETTVRTEYSVAVSNLTSVTLSLSNAYISLESVIGDYSSITIVVERTAASEAQGTQFSGTYSNTNGVVTLSENAPDQNFWTSLYRCSTSRVIVKIPNVHLASTLLDIKTNTAVDIKVERTVYFKNIHISTFNGRVSLDRLNAVENITCSTSNGPIELGTLKASSITIYTSNGPISASLLDVTNQLRTTTSNGQIDLAIVTASNGTDISLMTSNGLISAGFSGFRGSFDASTLSGIVTVAGPQVYLTVADTAHKKGFVSSGSGNLRGDTSNGNISFSFF